jgi:ABC-2 type transport system ATP-binding protein
MHGYNRMYEDMRTDTIVLEEAFITLDAVSKRFSQVEVVSNVSMNIEKGKILGIMGSDGAGKSTLLRMMATMIRPSSGKIFIHGLDVVSQRKKIKTIIGYMPQRFGLYQDLTVGENFNFFMDIFGIAVADRDNMRDFYLGFSELLPFLDRLATDLSGGMKQKLALACVLVHRPKVLILDEPTNGVDPVSRMEFWEMLFQMKKQGMTIILSTVYLDELELCDKIAIMHNAHLLALDAPNEIKSQFSNLEEAIIHRIHGVDDVLIHQDFKF